MEIACVGCSWTYGYGIDRKDTYPEILNSVLEEHNVTNYGMSGVSLPQIFHKVVELVSTNKPDAIIIQGTTLDRASFGKNGYESFIKEQYLPPPDDYTVSLVNITPATYVDVVEGGKGFFEELVDNIQYKGSKEDLAKFIKVYVENVMYDRFTLDNHLISLATLQSYLNEKGVRHIFFPYLDYTWSENPNFNIWETNFGNIVDSSKIIKKPFYTWLKENTPNNYYIDNGFHLGKEGNEILVKEYLLPNLKEILNEN